MNLLYNFNFKIILPQAGVEPAFSRLEVGRDIHFATKVLYIVYYIFKLQCNF